jgi:hypothetical protein
MEGRTMLMVLAPAPKKVWYKRCTSAQAKTHKATSKRRRPFSLLRRTARQGPLALPYPARTKAQFIEMFPAGKSIIKRVKRLAPYLKDK